jgi:sulfate permease, SulP family
MCSLAAILVVVAFHMSEWQAFRALFRAPRRDVAVLLTTFLITIIFDLALAVQIGVILAALLFVKRMADLTRVGALSEATRGPAYLGEIELDHDAATLSKRGLPANVEVYEIQGHFCFGAADKLRQVMPIIARPPRVLILRLRHVAAIDATGLHALSEFHKECCSRGTHLILSSAQPHVLEKLRRWHASEHIGHDNIVDNIDTALRRSREVLAGVRLIDANEVERKVA